MPALLYGLEAWGKIDKDEMNEIEKIQGRALKRIFNVPISTSYIGLIMETGTWPANQRIQYSIMMLYHNIMNSDHKRVARKILAEQAKSNHKNTMISKVQQIAQQIEVEDKWERKKYLQEYDSDTIKDVIKIRLHMWQVNCNYNTELQL